MRNKPKLLHNVKHTLLLPVFLSLLLSAAACLVFWLLREKPAAQQAGLAYDNIVWNNVTNNPFGTGKDWNAIILEDVENLHGAQGALAVGGSLRISGGNGFDAGYANGGTGAQAQASAKGLRLLVGGKLDMEGLLHVNGNAMVGGSARAQKGSNLTAALDKEYTYQLSDLTQLYNTEAIAGRILESGRKSYTIRTQEAAAAVITPLLAKADLSAFFQQADVSLFAQHAVLARLSGGGTITPSENLLTLGSDEPDTNVNVFTLDLSGAEEFSRSLVFDLPENCVSLVNIISDESITLNGDLAWGSPENAGNVLYHFVNAREIVINASSKIYGSILAPQASLSVLAGSGEICGTVALKSLCLPENNRFQLNWSPFTGFIPVKLPIATLQGQIMLAREGEVFMHTEQKDGVYQAVFANARCAGAVYEIYADDTVLAENGALLIGKGTLVDTVVTGKDGTATTRLLPFGTYLVREVTAPGGLARAKEEQLVTIASQNTPAEPMLRFSSKRQKLQIDMLLRIETDLLFTKGTAESAIKNTLYGLFAAQEINAKDQTVIPKDALVAKIAFSAAENNALSDFRCAMPNGTYYLKQMQSDDYCVLQNKIWEVSYDDSISSRNDEVVSVVINDNAEIVHPLLRGTLYCGLGSADANGLAGARIGLFPVGETDFVQEKALKTVISADNGSFSFPSLPAGDWIVAEIGEHRLSLSNFTLQIREHNQTVVRMSGDSAADSAVRLTVQDALEKERDIPLAEFTVYADGNRNGTFESSADIFVGILSGGDAGAYAMQNLPLGNYFLVMKTAPSGYKAETEAIPFSVTAHNQTVSLVKDAPNAYTLNPATGNILLQKETQAGLHLHSVFRVEATPNGGYPVDSIIEPEASGSILLSDLRTGVYRITEGVQKEEGFSPLTPTQTVTLQPGGLLSLTFDEDLYGGQLILEQLDAYTGAPVPQGSYVLLDTSGTIIHEGTADQNGVYRKFLNPGTYYCLTKSVSDAYFLPLEARVFTIASSTQTVTMKQEAIPRNPTTRTIPQPGTSLLSQLLSVFFVSLSACAAIAFGIWFLILRHRKWKVQ